LPAESVTAATTLLLPEPPNVLTHSSLGEESAEGLELAMVMSARTTGNVRIRSNLRGKPRGDRTPFGFEMDAT
jgi:hypothetical protein